MKITPIAFDSLGTRGMATFVETGDCNILIDPGVSLAPVRYGLPPHSLELKRMKEHWREIKKLAKKSDVLVVSHYHYDHHNPEEPEVFKGKTLLLKHPTENINQSQGERAAYFLQKLGKLPKKIEWAEGKELVVGRTRILCSPPVFHGTSPKLGHVVETLVEEGKEKFIHTSDVEGPSQAEQAAFVLKHRPRVVFLDGPLSYMIYRFGMHAIGASVQNMIGFVQEGVETLVVDHHLLRDLHYKERLAPVYAAAEKTRARVVTAAEFARKKIDMLEAKRKELYMRFPEKTEGKKFSESNSKV
ncbi:MAG: MBL fold metallo-hydrolase [Candidatus Micrarchaeia archaeon]